MELHIGIKTTHMKGKYLHYVVEEYDNMIHKYLIKLLHLEITYSKNEWQW